MKTTEKDYKLFKQEFMYWAGLLNVTNYNIYFLIKDTGNNQAQIEINENSKTAWVTLNKEMLIAKVDEKKRCIKEAAVHEAFHLFLEQITSLAGDSAPKWVVTGIDEGMVNTFTHLIKVITGEDDV